MAGGLRVWGSQAGAGQEPGHGGGGGAEAGAEDRLAFGRCNSGCHVCGGWDQGGLSGCADK